MNRISSYQRHRHAVSLSEAAQSTERMDSALNRLTGGSLSTQTQNVDDCGVVHNEVTEYNEPSSSALDTTAESETHSSIFSSSSKNDETSSSEVQGGYSPNKSTLGLELVASPSLLEQVLCPGENTSMGGSTLSSTRSFRKELEQAEILERYEGTVAQVTDDDGAIEERDDIFDDESTAYSAMRTVAQTIISVKETIQEPEAHQSLPLKSTYSMRSIKTSEGIEMEDFILDPNHLNQVREDSPTKKSIAHPFDEIDAQIIASSKAAAATSPSKPLSCLRPSSFSTQYGLVSPALIQSGRVHRSSARMAKCGRTFDRRPENESPVQMKGIEVESNPRYNPFTVSFAENLEKRHSVVVQATSVAATAPLKAGNVSGIKSPTSVNEFFSDEAPQEKESISQTVAQKQNTKAVKKKSEEKNEEKIFSPAEQEGIIPSIVQSVSDLDFPQFTTCIDEKESKIAKTDFDERGAGNKEMISQPNNDNDESYPFTEVDAAALLNTSDESMNTKRKRFHLPRLRRSKNGKRFMRLKLFGGKAKEVSTTNEKKEDEKAPVKTCKERISGELEKIEEVEKYIAWSAPTTQSAEDDCPVQDVPPKNEATVSATEQARDELDGATTPSILPAIGTAVVATVASVGAVNASQNADEPITSGTEPTEPAEMTSEQSMIPPTAMEQEITTSTKNNPIPFVGARAPSSSSKHSTTSLTSKTSSKSSFTSKHSESPKRVSLELLAAESSSHVNSMGTGDCTPLLGNDKHVFLSLGGDTIEDALFNDNENPMMTSEDTSCDKKNSSFEEEMANAQIIQLFPEVGSPHFVGSDTSGEIEHGVEVEWGSAVAPNEFGEKWVSLDVSEDVDEQKESVSDPKWENHSDVDDDISWPSGVTSMNIDKPVEEISEEDKPLKIVNDSQINAEDKANVVEEAFIKSGGTKLSTLNPKKLFRGQSKEIEREKRKEEEEEEPTSDFKRFVARKKKSPNPAEKRSRQYSSRCNNIVGKHDSRSVDDESDYFSSDNYSSDGREDADVVGALATHIQKGLTGIVDMMETAFAFNKDDETFDFEGESSDSEAEEAHSYIQRRIESRRDKQRKLLRDARRSSERRRHLKGKKSRSSRFTATRDNEYIASDKQHRRRSGQKPTKQRHASSGRARSCHQAEDHGHYDF